MSYKPVASHGTAVAGVIAARDNGVGVVGIAPRVRILPVRVTNSSNGSAYLSDLAACVRYAGDHGARVVNVSYSGAESNSIDAAATYARNKGTLLFMAAGNSGVDISSFPAYPSFLTVGATTSKDERSSFSNYGKAVDLVAPGSSILTTVPGKAYSYMSGTSFSSPLIAGVAALIFSVRPDLKPKDVEAILRQTAVNIGDAFYFGSGRVSAAGAVALARTYKAR
jgi:thermitase